MFQTSLLSHFSETSAMRLLASCKPELASLSAYGPFSDSSALLGHFALARTLIEAWGGRGLEEPARCPRQDMSTIAPMQILSIGPAGNPFVVPYPFHTPSLTIVSALVRAHLSTRPILWAVEVGHNVASCETYSVRLVFMIE